MGAGGSGQSFSTDLGGFGCDLVGALRFQLPCDLIGISKRCDCDSVVWSSVRQRAGLHMISLSLVVVAKRLKDKEVGTARNPLYSRAKLS